MAHKRGASEAELAERVAKLASAPAPSGRAPPPNPLKGVTIDDIAGHEDAWEKLLLELAEDTEYSKRSLRKKVEESKRATLLKSERAVLSCPSVDVGATFTDVASLVWVENDADVWETSDFEETCVCCNRMEESWRHKGRHGYDVEPRWRIVGSSKFVCRWCYDSLAAGHACKITL